MDFVQNEHAKGREVDKLSQIPHFISVMFAL